jgi:dynein light chain LC8-type
MPEYMQQDCFDCGLESMERCKEESKIAEYIKKEFDRKYSQTWHCIVGSAFGYFVTHETNTHICFDMRKLRVVLFKYG